MTKSVRFGAALSIVALATAGAVVWARRDYRSWLALGAGGLPSNWWGWLQTTRWRMMKRDPFSIAPFLPGVGQPGAAARLAGLPKRRGSRPRVAPHPVPHRQVSETAPEPVRRRLQALFEAKAGAEHGILTYAKSYFEKHNDAVTLRDPDRGHPDARASHGEIGHVHPSDGSMHVILSSSDAKAVVEAGWGERHGLAGVTLGLPTTYMLIYAPRDESEVAVAAEILDAAVSHMAGPMRQAS